MTATTNRTADETPPSETSSESKCFDLVIVPIDPGHEKHRELVPAATLASMAGAEIVLLTISRSGHQPDAADIARVDALRQGLHPRPARVEWAAASSPAEGIVSYAREHANSIICMASHGPGRLSENLHTTVSAPVVQGASCPVVLVGPHCVRGDPTYSELVACIDLTPVSDDVVATAGRWAKALGLAPWLVEAVNAPNQHLTGQRIESQLLAHHARALKGLGLEANWDVLHDRHQRHGHHAIVQWVEVRPNAIVMMGSHGHTPLQHLATGSSVMHVAHDAQVPIVVIPAHQPVT